MGSSCKIVELPYCEPEKGLSCQFFAESYTLCAPKLNSVGWQCAILGQLMGTRQIQDGCSDPIKLQNVFIFAIQYYQHHFGIYTHALAYEELMEPFLIMSDYVHVTEIQHGRHIYQQ